ncbi:hypothetical protein [Oryza sativa Japonica Group]|uniref:Uncharacterized protein P0436D06.4 n=1 Tax=Oryza sativa subsp. japonica TaxID=39947 RepID=Q5QN99_ORYSJ|nr:hypothetical protein [Oryza sativa Japonica Group]
MVARLPSACASSDAPWLPGQPSFLASSTLVEPREPALEVDPRWPGGGKGGIDRRGEAVRTSRGGENRHAEQEADGVDDGVHEEARNESANGTVAGEDAGQNRNQN